MSDDMKRAENNDLGGSKTQGIPMTRGHMIRGVISPGICTRPAGRTIRILIGSADRKARQREAVKAVRRTAEVEDRPVFVREYDGFIAWWTDPRMRDELTGLVGNFSAKDAA